MPVAVAAGAYLLLATSLLLLARRVHRKRKQGGRHVALHELQPVVHVSMADDLDSDSLARDVSEVERAGIVHGQRMLRPAKGRISV